MRIDSIALRKLTMRLTAPFETSMGVTQERPVLLLEVKSEGFTGWSEITTTDLPTFTAESVITAGHVIRDFFVAQIVGKEVSAGDIPRLFAPIRGHEMAKAGIENALWDIESQRKGVSLSELLGGTQKEIPCGVSLGIHANPEALLDRVASELASGYRRIKLKIKPGKDIQFISAVRKAHPDILLSVDANCAYTLADTAHLQKLDEFNLLMIEQPLAWDDIYSHTLLQKQLRTSICLDECIRSLRDAVAAVELGACRIINIKLGRVGGHSAARDIQAYCLSKNIPVWCGGMLECGIGRAHNIAISSLPGYTLPGDVSASKRYWIEDVINPEVEVTPQGTIRVPTGPGLGYHVREDLINKWTQEKETWGD